MRISKKLVIGVVLALSMTGIVWVGGANFEGAIAVSQAAETDLTFSAGSGAYKDAFKLTLSAGEQTIYYTTDGSNPATSATRIKYTQPISIVDRKNDANVMSAVDPSLFDSANVKWDRNNKKFVSKISAPSNTKVDKATIIKAVSTDGTGTYSTVQTNTYFVGNMGDHIQGIQESCKASGLDLSIMSISGEKDDFFDSTKGIYVHGDVFDNAVKEYLKTGSISDWNAVDVARGLSANYNQKGRDWEREVHVDYFESNGNTTEVKLQQDCGIRIQGNYSRSDLQKGFRLYARADYGKKNFKYPFFGDTAKNDQGETIAKFKKLTLRNGGNCAFIAKYNDAFWQSLIRDLKCETQASRVCIVYLNGEYWGINILQEEYDDDYFEETHGVNKDNVVLYKGDAEAIEIGYKLDEGDLPAGETDVSYYFRDLLKFFETHTDLKQEEDYQEFASLVDVESVRDYFAVNVWVNNKWDWPGKNWSVWRVTEKNDSNPYEDGRWRFCFYDLDFAGVSGGNDAMTNTIKEDNYKPNGLLDMNTDNPVVLMYAYLMTNKGFRDDFADSLNALTTGNFEENSAIAAGTKHKDTYTPLYNQFFNRYDNVGSADDAIYGGYASHTCMMEFIEARPEAIPNILQWVRNFFNDPGGNETPPPTITPTITPSDDPGTSNPPGSTPAPSIQPTTPPQNTPTPGGKDDGKDNKAKKKISKLNVTAKKGKKTIKIATIKKSKVTVKLSRKIIVNGKKKTKIITYKASKNKKGTFRITLSKKLKKRDKITVKISKTGYKNKKKNVKIS